eukprot:CAMPEP_0194111380 /NCGR_PEP_ID=MMETSP0150-20130528/10396_1 /TAXON_ID=122233 /ORGANISM="Chaetoceros debilis, Strain MM31A-1" /LENGTH=215 /DNA_ID=CAMNT_0038800793 /DNA_START=48 /DNA_END=695 /DNA_ORIENTATION=+
MATSPPTEALSSLEIKQSDGGKHDIHKNMSVVNFCVEIPAALLGGDIGNGQRGIVGTITFLNTKSCMVWVGWGDIIDNDTNIDTTNASCGMPPMGPMCVAMPRTKFAGMSCADEAPCSQMIGGENEEEVSMGTSMACRLAKKVGTPVFVSCSLERGNGNDNVSGSGGGGAGGGGNGAMDDLQGIGDMGALALTQHACSLAEKEIGRIILERQGAK